MDDPVTLEGLARLLLDELLAGSEANLRAMQEARRLLEQLSWHGDPVAGEAERDNSSRAQDIVADEFPSMTRLERAIDQLPQRLSEMLRATRPE